MKKGIFALACLLLCLATQLTAGAQSLKIVIIRHGEKQEKLENLNCAGLNRSLKLVNVLYKKIGVPNTIYVPSLGNGSKTTHSRMFQTISPFASVHNSSINSKYSGTDFDSIMKDLEKQQGTVLFVWDHDNIAGLVKALGIKGKLVWNGADYDSIWMVTGKKKNRVLQRDKEGIVPSKNCGNW